MQCILTIDDETSTTLYWSIINTMCVDKIWDGWNQNMIVCTIFWLISNQTEFREEIGSNGREGREIGEGAREEEGGGGRLNMGGWMKIEIKMKSVRLKSET